MRPYFIEQIEISGYRKFGLNPVIFKPSYPDFKTKGSGLNIIVGSIGSGKTSLLEVVNGVCGNGFHDTDKMIRNDNLPIGKMPFINTNWVSPAIDKLAKKNYSSSLHFAEQSYSRLLSINKNEDLSNLAEEDRPSGVTILSIQPNRYFVGEKSNNYPTMPNGKLEKGFVGTDYKSANINLTTIGSALDADIHGMGTTNRKQFEETLKEFNHLGLDVSSITVSEPQRNGNQDVFLNAKLGSGKDHSLQDLSDGNKELLYWLYELKFNSDGNSSIICIDEIERSLHPQLQQEVLEILYEKSSHQQIFITTHSIHIADHLKAGAIHRLNTSGNINTINRREFPKISIYSIDHRRLLFTDLAIFVEGVKDFEYFYNKLYELKKFRKLTNSLFISYGKDNISNRSFEKLCDKLGVKFSAIVDDDFSERIKRSDTSKKIPSHDVINKKCRKVDGRNIFVLKYGRFEEYDKGIDRNGNDVQIDQLREIQDIFEMINDL